MTIDDIVVNGTATITDAHLGKIAAGHDLDDARISLKVNNDGLSLTGHGAFGTVPTDIALEMSFTDGPPSQVLQHVTAMVRPMPPRWPISGFLVVWPAASPVARRTYPPITRPARR